MQIVGPNAVGGGTDRQARLLPPILEEILGRPAVVQNLSNGGGHIAVMAILREAADYHTIVTGPDFNLTVGVRCQPITTTPAAK